MGVRALSITNLTKELVDILLIIDMFSKNQPRSSPLSVSVSISYITMT